MTHDLAQYLACVDRVALRHAHARDRASCVGVQLVLHLHCLDDHRRGADIEPVAGLYEHPNHSSRHRRPDRGPGVVPPAAGAQCLGQGCFLCRAHRHWDQPAADDRLRWRVALIQGHRRLSIVLGRTDDHSRDVLREDLGPLPIDLDDRDGIVRRVEVDEHVVLCVADADPESLLAHEGGD